MMKRLFPRWLRMAAGTWFILCGAALGVAVQLARAGALRLPFPTAHPHAVVAGGTLLAAAWAGVGVTLLAVARRGRPVRSPRQRAAAPYLHAPLH